MTELKAISVDNPGQMLQEVNSRYIQLDQIVNIVEHNGSLIIFYYA